MVKELKLDYDFTSMKISFGFPWVKNPQKLQSYFKSSPCALLVQEYTKRIHNFTPCEISGGKLTGFTEKERPANSVLWLCDRGPKAKVFSSEDVAKKLADVMNTSSKTLYICLGLSEGFDENYISENKIKIDLRWSFGPMTLPHELAAVVCVEQIYRALEIRKGGPYHK